MIDVPDIRCVAESHCNLQDCVGQLKRNDLVLSVDGRAELFARDAKSYQALLDRLEGANLGRGQA